MLHWPASKHQVVNHGTRSLPQVLLQYCKANDLKPDTLHPDLKARDMPDADGLAKVRTCTTDTGCAAFGPEGDGRSRRRCCGVTMHQFMSCSCHDVAHGIAQVVQGVTDGLEDLASDEGWQVNAACAQTGAHTVLPFTGPSRTHGRA